MGRFLVVVLLLAAGVIALGFYMNWFQFATESGKGKTDVKVTIDRDQIKADADKAREKVSGLVPKGKEQAEGPKP
jgi:hypothetical protein